MAGKIIDASALLAYFRDGPAADAVEQILIAASRRDTPLQISHVAFAELKHVILRAGGAGAWKEAARILQGMPIELQPTTRSTAELAAEYQTNHGLKPLEAFSAALARERKAELVTASAAFGALNSEIKIQLVGH